MKLLLERWRKYILDESTIGDVESTPPGDFETDETKQQWKELTQMMSAGDPSKKNKYLRWLSKHLGRIFLPYDDNQYPNERADELNFERIKTYIDLLKKYHILLPHIKASPEHKMFADINRVDGISPLRYLVREVEAIENEKAALNKTKLDVEKLAHLESKIIIDADNYIVRRPYTTVSCKYFGEGAPWCIAAKRNNQFVGYNDEGMIPYLINIRHKDIPHGHPLKRLVVLVHYDSYDPDGETKVDDQVYDGNNRTMSMEDFQNTIEDIIPVEELWHILEEIKMETILRPPYEEGIGSDIGEPFLGDAEWKPKFASGEDIVGDDGSRWIRKGEGENG